MAQTLVQKCHALTSHYISVYTEVNKSKPQVNRNKARWGFESVLMDMSYDEAKALIEFYVRHYVKDLDFFLYNYEKIAVAKEEYERTEEIRAQRRKETAKRTEEWRKRWRPTS